MKGINITREQIDTLNGFSSAPMMGIKELVKAAHSIADSHGWHDTERTFGDVIALCHSELSEALEEYRDNGYMYWENSNGKPEGIAVELADVLIRIFDFMGEYKEIDFEKVVHKKMVYNNTREYRHGGKQL